MKIWEYDLGLYGLLRRCVRGDFASAATDPLTPKMRQGILEALPDISVGKKCECGEIECRSFRTTTQPQVGEAIHHVRFHVHGELHVKCSDEGRIFAVTYLPEDVSSTPVSAYTETHEGWIY